MNAPIHTREESQNTQHVYYMEAEPIFEAFYKNRCLLKDALIQLKKYVYLFIAQQEENLLFFYFFPKTLKPHQKQRNK